MVLVSVAGCHVRRPNFMTRVQEDCVAGDQWACDLAKSLGRAGSAEDINVPDGVADDVDAIMKGIERARSGPNLRYPDVPLISRRLPTHPVITKFSPLSNLI